MARQVLLVALIVFTHGILLVAGQDDSECDPTPCLNGATCVAGTGNYTCTCVDGWTGTDCETVLCDIGGNVCANGGTCLTDNTCTCAAGYTGDLCDTDIKECDSEPCKNSATCVDEVAGYTCTCEAGWTGTNCESESGASLSTASCLILALALALTKMATD